MLLEVKLSICLSLILISQLNKKDTKIIFALLIPMLKIVNSSKNLLISVAIIEKNEIVGRNIIDRTIQICSSPKSLKIYKICQKLKN